MKCRECKKCKPFIGRKTFQCKVSKEYFPLSEINKPRVCEDFQSRKCKCAKKLNRGENQ